MHLWLHTHDLVSFTCNHSGMMEAACWKGSGSDSMTPPRWEGRLALALCLVALARLSPDQRPGRSP